MRRKLFTLAAGVSAVVCVAWKISESLHFRMPVFRMRAAPEPRPANPQEIAVNRWPLAASAALLLLIGAEPVTRPSTIPCEKIGNGVVILGELGLPVGQACTVTGVKKAVGPLPEMFTVETIDGKAAPHDLRIQVNGLAKWPDGAKATLRGYEVGTLRFQGLDGTNYSGADDPRYKGPHQRLLLHFEVTELVEPRGLKLAPRQ
jgi:hypothetical protein